MGKEILSTNRKALQINLQDNIYGSFAEIGGGQEVARQFFLAGGASGTVAKTVSAYDKLFSDWMYNENKSGRYVSGSRLAKMLNTEFREVTSLLQNKRTNPTRFFAFANTVTTINYQKDNYSHGWIGMHFQIEPGTPPNKAVLHVNLLENDPILQQQTLGILGVNLVWACYHKYTQPNEFLQSLLDNLSADRVEITMIRMNGPQMDYVDNRLLSVQLVKNGMTSATMFDRNGNVQQPADMLYKKNVLAFRGSFRPITYVGFDMLKTSYRMFKKDEDYDRNNTLALCEMTLNNLLEMGDLDERDFLARVDLLTGMGQNVMISNFREYYKLVSYFSRFRINNLRIVIGIPTFLNVLDKKYYVNLKGGIFEAFGKLFVENMKLYVYPTVSSVSVEDKDTMGTLITSKNIPLPGDLKFLYKYLIRNGKILDLKEIKKEWLYINSANVLNMIHRSQPGWEKMVPRYVEKTIKAKNLFGYLTDAEKTEN